MLLSERSASIQRTQVLTAAVKLFENPFALQHLIPTLWLFTESDFATFVVPNTCFGVFGALAGPLLTNNVRPQIPQILIQTAFALLFNWTNILVHALANQCEPDSVLEDSLNKPKRPIPTGRISAAQTRQLLVWALPVVLAINWWLGTWIETTFFFHLTWMYTHLGGGDSGFILRNVILAGAYGLSNLGSLRLAAGSPTISITTRGYVWVALISAVALTTAQVPDMKDQAGDASRGRRTCPLVLGDEVARWTIAVPVAIWSLALPAGFFTLGVGGCAIPSGLGATVVYRIIRCRNQIDDYYTWKLWTVWIAALYALPLFADSQAFIGVAAAVIKG